MNPKAETVEELQGRRKALHLGMIKLAREDLALRLQAAMDSHTVLSPRHAAPLPPHSPMPRGCRYGRLTDADTAGCLSPLHPHSVLAF